MRSLLPTPSHHHTIQRRPYPHHPLARLRLAVRVDHRRLHIRVTQQLLDRADVVPILQQVRRETVPKRVAGHALGQLRLLSRLLDRGLDRRFKHVPPPALPRVGVPRQLMRGEEVLPLQRPRGLGRLARKRPGQFNPAFVLRQVTLVDLVPPRKLLFKRLKQDAWKQRDPVFCTLALTDGDLQST